MAFGRKKKSNLPAGAKLARRQRRSGGADTGYFLDGQFYLLDGSSVSSTDYSNDYEYIPDSQVERTLNDAGYTSDTSSSSGYGSSSDSSYGSSSSGYSSSDSGSYGSSSSGYSSSDSGSYGSSDTSSW